MDADFGSVSTEVIVAEEISGGEIVVGQGNDAFSVTRTDCPLLSSLTHLSSIFFACCCVHSKDIAAKFFAHLEVF